MQCNADRVLRRRQMLARLSADAGTLSVWPGRRSQMRYGTRCDHVRVGNLSIEASTVIFDPYKLAATGTPRQVLLCGQSARLRPGKLPRHESGGKTRVQLA